jgi:hypothetical protein
MIYYNVLLLVLFVEDAWLAAVKKQELNEKR